MSILKNLDGYFTDPQPCTVMQEVREWLQSDEAIEQQTREDLRQLRMWDNLGSQIVGAEDPEMTVL